MHEGPKSDTHFKIDGKIDPNWIKQELFKITRSENLVERIRALNVEVRNEILICWYSEYSNPDSQIAFGTEFDDATFAVIENLQFLEIKQEVKVQFISQTFNAYPTYYKDHWDSFGITEQTELTQLCNDRLIYNSEKVDFLFEKLSHENRLSVFLKTITQQTPFYLLGEIFDKFSDTISKLSQNEFEEILYKNVGINSIAVDYLLSNHYSDSPKLREQLVSVLAPNDLISKAILLIRSELVFKKDLETIIGCEVSIGSLPFDEDEKIHFSNALEVIALMQIQQAQSLGYEFPMSSIKKLFEQVTTKVTGVLANYSFHGDTIEVQNRFFKNLLITQCDDVHSDSLAEYYHFVDDDLAYDYKEENIRLFIHTRIESLLHQFEYLQSLKEYVKMIDGFLNEAPEFWKSNRMQYIFQNKDLANLGIASLSPQTVVECDELKDKYSEMKYADSVKKMLEIGISQSPSDIPLWFNCILAESKDQRVIMALLRGAITMKLTGIEPPESIKSNYKECSRWLLGKIIGVDVCNLLGQKEISENSSREIYLGLLELSSTLKGIPIKDVIPLSSELFLKQFRSETLELIHKVTTLINLNTPLITVRGLIDQSKSGLDTLISKIGLLNSDLTEVRSRISKKLNELFKSALHFDENEITDEQLESLQNRWGTLEPFLIMQSFLRHKSFGWTSSSRSPLKDVLFHTIQGTFLRFKYEDDIPAEERQIGFLSKQQESAWRENPSSLRAYAPVENLPKDYEAQYETLFRTNILPHIKQLNTDPGLSKSEKRDALIDQLIEAYQQNNKAILIEICKNIRDKSTAYDMHYPGCAQIRADFKQLLFLLDPSMQSKKNSKNSIHFCTITDDPNLMIKIGRVVQAASCQDYLIGSFRNTLPAYVIDANIKGAFGFSIDKSDFLRCGYSASEYDSVFENLLNKPSSITYHFDPALQQLKIVDRDKVFSISMSYGVRRNILRLGENEEGLPDILIERPYLQNFEGEFEIAAQLDALIKSFRNSINKGKPSKFLSFVASRNPFGGVYSDAAGGNRTGSYFIDLGSKNSEIPQLIAS